MNRQIAPSVLRAAGRQAWITTRRKYTGVSGISALALSPILLAVLWFARDADFMDTVAAGTFLFAGFLAFGIISAAVIGVGSEIQSEREDGTLLRAKAVPHGMTGHLLAKLIGAPADLLLPFLPLLVLGPFVVPGLLPAAAERWLLLMLMFVLASAAMMAWGAVFGSIFRSMLGLGLASMGIYLLAAVSGIFYPITALPSVLQWAGQATPLYWIGLGFRRALLPDAAVAAEIGGVWRTELVVLVLLAWAVVGVLLASWFLRRMARRQSGSEVAAARERVLARGY